MQVSTSNKINAHLIASSVALLSVFLWLYHPVISVMVSEWYNNPNHSHGFMIPLIAGYFIWTRSENLKEIELKPTNWGLLLMSGGLIMYFLGDLGAAYTTKRVSMLVVLAGIIIFIYGKDLFKGILFPFFFLLLMIPVPNYLYETIAFPLKLFVTKYSVSLLDSLGVLVLREGNVIMLENVTLQVVDACSGIRSLTSIIVVGIALAYISQRTNFLKVLLVLSAVPIAVCANIARIVITGILAKSYGSDVAEGFFHEFTGLAVFAVEIVLLGFTAFLLNKLKKKKYQR